MVRRLGRPSPTWRSFLRNQAAGIAAIDMFVVASVSFRLLYRAIRSAAAYATAPASSESDAPSPSADNSAFAFLAPDIIESIVEGRQPSEMTAEGLTRHTAIPIEWRSQRAALNFQ